MVEKTMRRLIFEGFETEPYFNESFGQTGYRAKISNLDFKTQILTDLAEADAPVNWQGNTQAIAQARRTLSMEHAGILHGWGVPHDNVLWDFKGGDVTPKLILTSEHSAKIGTEVFSFSGADFRPYKHIAPFLDRLLSLENFFRFGKAQLKQLKKSKMAMYAASLFAATSIVVATALPTRPKLGA